MAEYKLNPVNGDQFIVSNQAGQLYHHIAIRVNGTNPSGTVTVEGRAAGSDVYESIPDAIFDLSALATVLFTGCVVEFKVTIQSISGVSSLILTDTFKEA